MGDSGGGGGQSTGKSIPDWAAPYIQDYLGHGANLSRTPAPDSGIPGVAPWNDLQDSAARMNYARAVSGSPESNAGRAALTGFSAGNMGNPWQQGLTGIASGQANQNPYNSFFEGASQANNPYFIDPEQMISANTDTMTKAAQRGAMAQTDSAANRAGAYGGSAYQEMQAQNASDLAGQVGQMAASTRMGANQQNANLWNSNFANQMGAATQGAGLFNQGIGQQMNAIGMGGSMYQGDMGNMLTSAGLAPAYGQMDNRDFGMLGQSGNDMQGYQQNLLNYGNQQYNNQVQWPFTMNDYMGNVVNNSIGNYFTGQNSQVHPPGTDWAATGAGAAMSLLPLLLL